MKTDIKLSAFVVSKGYSNELGWYLLYTSFCQESEICHLMHYYGVIR